LQELGVLAADLDVPGVAPILVVAGDQAQVVLDAVIVQVAARVGRVKSRAVPVGIDLFEHRNRLPHLVLRFSGQPQHIVGPDFDAVLATDARRRQVLFPGGPFAQEFEHAVAAAFKADEIALEPHLRHASHHVLVPGNDVGAALAEEGLAEPPAFVQVAEFQHPLAVFGQAIVVEHKAGKPVAVAQIFQLGDDVGRAAFADLAAKQRPLGRLAKVAVVLASPPGDDGQEGSRQVGDKGHLGRVQGIAVLFPLGQKEIPIREGQSVQVGHFAFQDAVLGRAAGLKLAQQPGKGDLSLAGDHIVKLRDLDDLLNHNGGVGAADHDHGVGQDFFDDARRFGGRIIVHAHHCERGNRGSPFLQLRSKFVPA